MTKLTQWTVGLVASISQGVCDMRASVALIISESTSIPMIPISSNYSSQQRCFPAVAPCTLGALLNRLLRTLGRIFGLRYHVRKL